MRRTRGTMLPRMPHLSRRAPSCAYDAGVTPRDGCRSVAAFCCFAAMFAICRRFVFFDAVIDARVTGDFFARRRQCCGTVRFDATPLYYADAAARRHTLAAFIDTLSTLSPL